MPDGHPRELVETVLDGLRAVVPADWTVTHARGADIASPAYDPDWSIGPDGQPQAPVFTPASVDEEQLSEAVAAAEAAGYAVVVVGTPSPYGGGALDRHAPPPRRPDRAAGRRSPPQVHR